MPTATDVELLATTEGRRLLTELGRRPPGDFEGAELVATIGTLRHRHSAELVAAAVNQTRLRRRAAAKFGSVAGSMFFTADGLEQATRSRVAAHRARRYAGSDCVLDLCCGIGGDLLAFTAAGRRVTGVDADPVTVSVARANVGALGYADRVEIREGDATAVDLRGWPAAFCDPARRTAGRRTFDPSAYSPPFAFLQALADAVRCVGAKVAPGIPHRLVPPGVEAEWVSDDGDVVETALWYGELATAARRATLLPSGATLVATSAEPAPVGPVGRFLYEPDGAVIRAHLVAEVAAEVGGRCIDKTIAFITADVAESSAFARCFEVTDVLPFSLKRLRAMLQERDVGRVTIKKRGSALDVERLRRDLRLRGSGSATIVLTRVAEAPTALVVRPLGSS